MVKILSIGWTIQKLDQKRLQMSEEVKCWNLGVQRSNAYSILLMRKITASKPNQVGNLKTFILN